MAIMDSSATAFSKKRSIIRGYQPFVKNLIYNKAAARFPEIVANKYDRMMHVKCKLYIYLEHCKIHVFTNYFNSIKSVVVRMQEKQITLNYRSDLYVAKNTKCVTTDNVYMLK